MERVRLDQHALKIQLAKELSQHCPLMVLTGGVAGLTKSLRKNRLSSRVFPSWS
jgi:hypothetical protein